MSRVFSFFSGLGLLDLGFELQGNFETVFINEKESDFLKSYLSNREGNTAISSNVPIEELHSKGALSGYLSEIVKTEKKRGTVGFIGGPPCPDFSVGGKNKGRTGDNGVLSKYYSELIIQQKPDWFMFENVKGLWRTKKHRMFYDELKKDFVSNGYVICDRLVNSLSYGVPQDRERIILFGIKEEAISSKLEYDPRTKIVTGESFGWDKYQEFKAEDIKKLDWPVTGKFGGRPKKPKDIPIELTVEGAFRTNKVQNHFNSMCHFTPRAGLKKFLKIDEGDVFKKSYKRLHRWRYSPTAAYGNNEVHLHPYKARRLSVSEVLSIQSAPSDFKIPLEVSLSAKFKMLGNGVPVRLAKGLAETIHHALE